MTPGVGLHPVPRPGRLPLPAASWVRIRAVKPVHLGLLLGLFSLGCASLSAQTHKASKPALPSSSKLISVVATGSKRYTSEQIVAATDLQRGKTVSEDDFKSVSQLLGETGAFSNVAYSFEVSPEGFKLDLQVTDSEPFVPVRFENFVWLSDQELLDKLHASVPLFQGQLPVSGRLVEQVSDALQTIAIERKLKGRVDYLRAGSVDGPIEAYEFSITGQDIRVRQVTFPGAGPEELPSLEAGAKQMTGQDYVRTILRVQADKNFLPVYLARGYLKASFSDAQPKVVQQDEDETVVDVAFIVSPGAQYKVNELQISGMKTVQVESLKQMIHLQMDQPANVVQLNKDIEAIKQLYGSRGYMAARVVAQPDIKDADSTVRYLINIQEGDVYKMGDLDIRGLDSVITQRVVAAWKIREGDTYDARYPKKFTQDVVGLLPGEDWNIVIHESVEDKDKTVDVSVHFERKQ
jgi:outer membrane protein assembly factor BamA